MAKISGTLVLCRRTVGFLIHSLTTHSIELRIMKTIFTSLVALSPASVCPGQSARNPKPSPPEMAAVLANDRAYEAAYAKADVEALAAFSPKTPTTPPTTAAPSAGTPPSRPASSAAFLG